MNVKGPNKHELYKWFAAQKEHLNAEPTWNFAKFLVDGEGHVVEYYPPTTDPEAIRPAIEKLIGANKQ